MGKSSGRRWNGKNVGTILVSVGLAAVGAAVVFAMGWQAIGKAIEAFVESLVGAAGGGVHFLVIVGIVLIASGASVLAFARHS